MQRYGQSDAMAQTAMSYGSGSVQPIIEVDGKLRFSLPGQPLFPPFENEAITVVGWVTMDNQSGKTFEKAKIKLMAEIRVVEHLFRWTNWEITAKSDAFSKRNAQTVEFRVPLKPDEEKKLSYTVHYSW